MDSFETEMPAAEENFAGPAPSNHELIGRAQAVESRQRVVLDMDSTETPIYGQQGNSAYNGHYESTCYHPLLLFHREGDCPGAKLRPGNVDCAEGAEELLPEIERKQVKEAVARADATFARPALRVVPEEQGAKYAIRIPANDSLERAMAELLRRAGPTGASRPSQKP